MQKQSINKHLEFANLICTYCVSDKRWTRINNVSYLKSIMNLYPLKRDENSLNKYQDNIFKFQFQLFFVVTFTGNVWYKIQADLIYFIRNFIENVRYSCVKGDT